MRTCKYCGTKLNFIGELKNNMFFSCEFCNLTFPKEETCFNRKRMNHVPNSYDTEFYLPTKELLKRNTIELFHILKDCRKHWYDILQMVQGISKLFEYEEPESYKENDDYKQLFNEYEELTKRKFIIENILIEKAGYIPERITDEFLSELVAESKNSISKPMNIYIKPQNKK